MARVDTSIYGQNPLRSVMDYAGQFDQADLRKQQLKQNALAFEDRQRGLQESNALRQALAQGVDPRDPAGQTKLMQIAPNAAGPVIKSLGDAAHVAATTRKSSADADAATFDLQVKKANKAIADIAALTSPEEAAKGIQEQLASGHLDQQKAQALLSGLPQDPAGFAQWQRKMLLAIMDAKDKLVATKPAFAFERAGGNIVPVQTNTDAGPVGQTAEMPAIPITQSADNIATNARAAKDSAANRAVQVKIAEMGDKRARDIAKTVDDRERAKLNGKPEKSLTEDQGKATSWLERMNQAEDALLKAPDWSLTSVGSGRGVAAASIRSIPFVGDSGVGKAAANLTESPERRSVLTSQETWVQGLLRSDTGAAYKDMEKDDIIRAFFPQPFDDEDLKAQKADLREGVRRSMQVRAGPGVDRLAKVPKSNQVIVDVKTDEDYAALEPGTRFRTPNGKTGTKR